MYKPVSGIFDWLKINSNTEECTSVKYITVNLINTIIEDINEAFNQNKKVLILFHAGDSVDNEMLDQKKTYAAYNYIPKEWKNLEYQEKIDEFLLMGPDNPLNYKKWIYQQWPKNTIRYAEINDYKLIYIQADLAYCQFPSTFARVMANDLFTEYTRIDDLYYHFKGSNISLYNVGDYEINNRIRRYLENLNNKDIIILKTPSNDTEWYHMSDSFLNSLYARASSEVIKKTYMTLPWGRILEITKNIDIPITARLVKVNYLGASGFSGTFTSLNGRLGPNQRYIVNNRGIINPDSKIPLIYLTNDDPINVYVVNNLSLGLDIIPDSGVYFDGTYEDPIVFYKDTQINPNIVRNAII